MDIDRYRGLRGVVRHLFPAARQRLDRAGRWGVAPKDFGNVRDPIGASIGYGDTTPYGTCVWCRHEARSPKGRALRWHKSCAVWYAIARGQRLTLGGEWVLPPQPCDCGDEGDELDHRVPIGLAVRQGIREYVRAFLPDNLKWLCHRCHQQKTRLDRQQMADVDAGRVRMFA